MFLKTEFRKSKENVLFGYSSAIALVLVVTFPGHVFGGDKELGESRYNESCVSCHGQAGKGAASYPKVSGNEIAYTVEKLEAYRKGIKQGPNSALMIMMAKPLSDQEINNLAAYLKDAKYEVN